MMNAAPLDSLSTNGFAIFRNVIPADKVVTFRQFTQSWLDNYLAQFYRKHGITELAEFTAKASQLSTDKAVVNQLDSEEQKIFSGGFPLEFRLSQELRDFMCSPELLALAQQILQVDSVAAHMPPMVRFISPNNSSAKVPAHIDQQYNEFVAQFYTVWIPLQDTNNDIGGVNIYCDEQGRGDRLNLTNANQADNHFWLGECRPTAGFQAQFQSLALGDVLVFAQDVLHESQGNRTNETRLSVDMRIFDNSSASKKHKIVLNNNTVIAP